MKLLVNKAAALAIAAQLILFALFGVYAPTSAKAETVVGFGIPLPVKVDSPEETRAGARIGGFDAITLHQKGAYLRDMDPSKLNLPPIPGLSVRIPVVFDGVYFLENTVQTKFFVIFDGATRIPLGSAGNQVLPTPVSGSRLGALTVKTETVTIPIADLGENKELKKMAQKIDGQWVFPVHRRYLEFIPELMPAGSLRFSIHALAPTTRKHGLEFEIPFLRATFNSRYKWSQFDAPLVLRTAPFFDDAQGKKCLADYNAGAAGSSRAMLKELMHWQKAFDRQLAEANGAVWYVAPERIVTPVTVPSGSQSQSRSQLQEYEQDQGPKPASSFKRVIDVLKVTKQVSNGQEYFVLAAPNVKGFSATFKVTYGSAGTFPGAIPLDNQYFIPCSHGGQKLTKLVVSAVGMKSVEYTP